MRAHLRCIAASLVLAGSLVLPWPSMDLGGDLGADLGRSLGVPVAHAQSSGGSMGGGSFGSGGGSYSGSSSSYSGSSRSYGSSSRSYSSSGGYSSGGSADCGGAGFSLLVLVGFVLFIAVGMNRRTVGSGGAALGLGGPVPGPGGAVDVTVLRVVVDWRERKFIQGELERIAKSADTRSTPGLVRMLREVTVVLRRVRDAWLYAGIVNARPMRAPEAEAFFQHHAQDARTRFREELIRNAGGATSTRAAGAFEARTEEGEGLVVITLIVAARGNMLDFHDLGDPEQVRRCLESLGNLTSTSLVAVEIVWSPAAENDRMSSAELERLYTDVHKIRGSAMAGRVHCTYCGGPFPAELESCPHCGARVPEQAA